MFGLNDEGKPAAASENEAGYTEEGQEAIEAGEAEEPQKPLDVTEFEIEDDEEAEGKIGYEHWITGEFKKIHDFQPIFIRCQSKSRFE